MVQIFCGIMDTQWCVKVSSACRGECVATGGLCRPAHLNSTEIKVCKLDVASVLFNLCIVSKSSSEISTLNSAVLE